MPCLEAPPKKQLWYQNLRWLIIPFIWVLKKFNPKKKSNYFFRLRHDLKVAGIAFSMRGTKNRTKAFLYCVKTMLGLQKLIEKFFFLPKYYSDTKLLFTSRQKYRMSMKMCLDSHFCKIFVVLLKRIRYLCTIVRVWNRKKMPHYKLSHQNFTCIWCRWKYINSMGHPNQQYSNLLLRSNCPIQ